LLVGNNGTRKRLTSREREIFDEYLEGYLKLSRRYLEGYLKHI